MRKITIAITAASFFGNKGAAAALKSSVEQLRQRYGERLRIFLMSTYPEEDRRLICEMGEEYSFIEVVSAKPAGLVFVAYPLALLYSLFKRVLPLKKLFELNKILRAYSQCDIVIDQAGVSFSDDRGFVMNTYGYICAAVVLLCGVPAVKYSQTIGGFKNGFNRFLAKRILPKMSLICVGGEESRACLAQIGVKDNVKVCADGAFSLPQNEQDEQRAQTLCDEDNFYRKRVIALCVSSVMEEKCRRRRKDYRGIMVQFVNWLNEQEYNVLIVASAARVGTTEPRNNDLILCSEIYDGVRDKSKVRWYHEDMSAGLISGMLARCMCAVASRFYATASALDRGIPVLAVGWGHKYKEALDMFDLGEYYLDYTKLELDSIKSKFMGFISEQDNIRAKIEEHLPAVRESSLGNINRICRIIDHIDVRAEAELERKNKKNSDDSGTE